MASETVSGTVECTWTRTPGPPPVVTLTSVRIVGGRLGDGTTEFSPVPEEWRAVLAALVGKRAKVTFDAATPPTTISKVEA